MFVIKVFAYRKHCLIIQQVISDVLFASHSQMRYDGKTSGRWMLSNASTLHTHTGNTTFSVQFDVRSFCSQLSPNEFLLNAQNLTG